MSTEKEMTNAQMLRATLGLPLLAMALIIACAGYCVHWASKMISRPLCFFAACFLNVAHAVAGFEMPFANPFDLSDENDAYED